MQVPLADQTHDLDAMAAAITDRTRLIFVCNPNNPTGTVVHPAELDRVPRPGARRLLVVLDEAYASTSATPAVPDSFELDRDRQRRRAAHLLQGLRPGRPAGRLRVAHEPVAAALRKTMCRSA